MRALKTILLLGALVLLPACAGRATPPTVTPTPAPTSTPTPLAVPVAALAAGDAALTQVRTYFPQHAPAAGLAWSAHVVSLPDAGGPLVCALETEGWTMLVRLDEGGTGATRLPVQVALDSDPAAWHWAIRLGADLALWGLDLNVSAEALAVRDIALAYLAQRHTDPAAPLLSLPWVGERTTPEGAPVHESALFRAAPWCMTVYYPLVPPERRSYHLALENEDSGYTWQGLMTPDGDLFEVQR